MFGLYVHIPFCKQACYYCDFHFSTLLKYKSDFLAALVKEIELRSANFLPDKPPLDTLYFGGGTPSLLTADELETIFAAVHKANDLRPDCEITLEANPDDLTPEKLVRLKQLGVNRLSVGVQTFDQSVLTFYNRSHTERQARDAITEAQAAGFQNISLDLIYGGPQTDAGRLENDLNIMIASGVPHISAYGLTIEEKTVFGRRKQKGRLKEAPEARQIAQYKAVKNSLLSAGFEHYEISNYAQPGFFSRHNTSYWFGAPYLGVGPGAHSYNGQNRYANPPNNGRYIRALAEGRLPTEKETLSQKDRLNDYILTRVRTRKGLDAQELQHDFGYAIRANRAYQALLDDGLLYETKNRIALTDRGEILADFVALRLFVD